MTKIIENLNEWRQERQQLTSSIGFVPTMGHLHAGHQSLLERSKAENDITVLSIFVNPTQFNNAADLANYPKTLEQDVAIAESLSVDYILIPDYEALYPDNYSYKITESKYSNLMEGKYRSGHFDGVLTVVMKLLMLVKATKAYFGEKDWQQLQLVTNMTQAFFVDTEVVGCPIVRDEHGLALSSRNSRLSPKQYQLARNFPKILASKNKPAAIINQLQKLGFKVDYVEEHDGRRFGAVWVGDVRLIDNGVMS